MVIVTTVAVNVSKNVSVRPGRVNISSGIVRVSIIVTVDVGISVVEIDTNVYTV